MSFNNINTKLRSERGFTIVELLIVIVVIGILAAITIVSFNGVTAKANTSSAQSAATAVSKKIEAYNAEVSAYPDNFSLLTDATKSGTSYYIPTSTYTLKTAAIATAPTTAEGPSTISIQKCGSPTAGFIIGYWSYSEKTQKTITTGTTTGTCTYITS